MCSQSTGPGDGPAALIIEDDPLTAWCLRSHLSSTFEVRVVTTLSAARAHLTDPRLKVIICGSPIVDHDLDALEQLSREPGHMVIALVSDTTRTFPQAVKTVEKPFALEQLSNVLGSSSDHTEA